MVYFESFEAIVQGARLLQRELNKLSTRRRDKHKITPIRPEDFIGLYDTLIESQELRDATRQLFLDGHYARAVEEAYKCINNLVKRKSGLSKDGQELMTDAFSVNNPILKLNALKTESHKNEQIGYMLILAGCMRGIRNPRAHEHELKDMPEIALEMLSWANHLIRVIHKSKRPRKQKKTTTP